MTSRISTSLPSARRQWVVSDCHSSLGRAASKRMNDERGRLWGWGVIRSCRRRTRHAVATEGGRAEAAAEVVGDRRQTEAS